MDRRVLITAFAALARHLEARRSLADVVQSAGAQANAEYRCLAVCLYFQVHQVKEDESRRSLWALTLNPRTHLFGHKFHYNTLRLIVLTAINAPSIRMWYIFAQINHE